MKFQAYVVRDYKMPDYYSILGVLPSADDAVIKAVYKALALKYHPDRNSEDANSIKRMAEINEAYAVLSDKEKRQAYDDVRRESSYQEKFNESERTTNDFKDIEDQIDYEWNLAARHYKDLDQILTMIGKFSNDLIVTYKIKLLGNRQFEHREILAESLIQEYLETYFGKNPRILAFARELLLKGRRDAARELNKAVRKNGKNLNPNEIILQITKTFDGFNTARDDSIQNDFHADESYGESWRNERESAHADHKELNAGAGRNSIGTNTKLVIGCLIAGFLVHLMGHCCPINRT